MPRLLPHASRLLSLLRRRGHTREEAEDLIQDAFLSLHTYCQKADVRSSEGFLVRAVLNRSASLHRARNRRHNLPGGDEELLLIDEAGAPDDLLAAEQRLERITRALTAVGPRTRDMFLLHRLFGFSYQEIARQLGVSVKAVERRIARAVHAVTDELHRE
jgi:RNA polymerase sigma-70 factor (ECF subfamily)